MAKTPLSRAARAFRAGHAVITAAFLSAIGYVWWCALTGRRDRRLRLAVAALLGEGAFVAANHGDCPLGPLQERLGDPIPLFELVLSPTVARRAVPALGLVTAGGSCSSCFAVRAASHLTICRSPAPDRPPSSTAA